MHRRVICVVILAIFVIYDGIVKSRESKLFGLKHGFKELQYNLETDVILVL